MSERIVELRQMGYTWYQVDQVMFPGTTKDQTKKKSPSWHHAKKHNLPVFTKQVIGGWGATQIVVPLRKFDPYEKVAA